MMKGRTDGRTDFGWMGRGWRGKWMDGWAGGGWTDGRTTMGGWNGPQGREALACRLPALACRR